MTTVTQLSNSPNQIMFVQGFAAGIQGAHLDEMTSRDEQEGWWETRRPLFPAMSAEAVTIENGNKGELHRAIVVARELVKAGMWDGQTPITILNPNQTFNKVFGFTDEPITSLMSGVDYRIEGQA